MKIVLPNEVVAAKNPVIVEMSDKGGGYVKAEIFVEDQNIVLLEAYHVSKKEEALRPLKQGMHDAMFRVAAFKGPLGKTYDTTLKINGQEVAWTKGTVTEPLSEGDYVHFNLQIV